MLKEIKISGLFDLYDYDIELKKDGITILTGPNGYGKTTILKIIDAISKLNLYDLISFPYKQIFLTFDSGNIIQIGRNEQKEEIKISDAKEFLKSFTKQDFISKMSKLLIEKRLAYSYDLKQDLWIQRSNEQQFTFGELIEKEKLDIDPEKMFGFSMKNELIDNVYFIPEHRLFRIQSFRNRNINNEDSTNRISYTATINSYSKELKEIIKTTLEKYAAVSQDLDSTFPRRLFEEKSTITQDDFEKRMTFIQKYQNHLNDFGISDFKQEKSTSFVNENAKPLLVYLNDTEKKLQVFDILLNQLELYVKIINERRFANKKIKITKDMGIEVTLDSDRKLDLAKLSSGEQQEIILLFELLFHTNQKDLIMIDEPEISLHVAWQKEFLNDLFEIQKITKSNYLLATHSPQIINDRWDLAIDLWGLVNEK